MPPVSKAFESYAEANMLIYKKQIISLFMWIQEGFLDAVCFIVSYRTLEKILDDKGLGGVVLMDLSRCLIF